MPRNLSLYPYKSGPIEPVVVPGEVVGIWINKQYSFFTVSYIEGIMRSNPIVFDFGALAAGATTAVVQITPLDMPGNSKGASTDSEFAQWRAAVVDDIEMILYQGRADQRHKTDIRVAVYNLFSRLNNPDANDGEFFVYGNDNHAFGQVTNQTDYAITIARVAFWGYRYVLESMPQYNDKHRPEIWTRIPATAHL